jgi:hypothetical protein
MKMTKLKKGDLAMTLKEVMVRQIKLLSDANDILAKDQNSFPILRENAHEISHLAMAIVGGGSMCDYSATLEKTNI